MSPENIQRLWAQTLIDQLKKHGINQFYISPGLRNAPLIDAALKYEVSESQAQNIVYKYRKKAKASENITY